MPREWGRDPFYTFLPRERMEGTGNADALMTQLKTQWRKSGFKTGFGYGFYRMPDVKDFRLNKYGMPSYHQINADLQYEFGKPFKNLKAQFLLVYKINEGEYYNELKYKFQKTDMFNINLVLNYRIAFSKK